MYEGRLQELMPGWLTSVSLLAGFRPAASLSSPSVLWIGGDMPMLSCVIACVHPESRVLVWDVDPGALARTADMGDAAALPNLVVSDLVSLASFLGTTKCDIVVIDGLLDAASDSLRSEVVESVATALRPGGLLGIRYRPLAGWAEVDPLLRVVDAIVQRDPKPRADAVPDALALLVELRRLGGAYFDQRPMACAWLDHVASDPSAVVEVLQVPRARRMSHASVVRLLENSGCAYVGSAHMAAPLDEDVPEQVASLLDGISSAVLRETYRDLATKRSRRVDVFQLGAVPLSKAEHADAVNAMCLTARGGCDTSLAAIDGSPAKGVDLHALGQGIVPVSDLGWPSVAHRSLAVRWLLGSGLAYPVPPGLGTPASVAAAGRLNAIVGGRATPCRERALVAPVIGSAIPAVPAPDEATRARLGIP